MRARKTTLIIALAAAIGLGGNVAPAAAACANENAAPGTVSAKALSKATLCLLNEERAERGLKPLKAQKKLAAAAKRHSKAMVKRRFFAHNAPNGQTALHRIKKARYTKGARAWGIGENIAYGTGGKATPASIVDGWMKSPGHKANILNGKFRHIGIGIVNGAPVTTAASVSATYTTNFGFRR